MSDQEFAIDNSPVGTAEILDVDRVFAERDPTVRAADLTGGNLEIALGAAADQRHGQQLHLLDIGFVVKNLQPGLHDGLIPKWR